MSEAFDPGRYLTKVGSADYLEVKWRLVWLRETHPEAEIETQAVTITAPTANPEGEHEGYAVFKATIRLPGGGSATGYGSETYSDFREYIEKAETKAIGRALAALGFGTQFCDDFAFSDGAKNGKTKIVDTPVDPAKIPARTRTTSENTIPDATGIVGWTEFWAYVEAAGYPRDKTELETAMGTTLGNKPAYALERFEAWRKDVAEAEQGVLV